MFYTTIYYYIIYIYIYTTRTHYHSNEDVISLCMRVLIRFFRKRLASLFIVCMCVFFFQKTINIVFTERSHTVRPRPATGIQVVASTYLGTYLIVYYYVYDHKVHTIRLRVRVTSSV